MNTQSTVSAPVALLREADARMAQALDNFFQRSRIPIQDAILRAVAAQPTPSTMAIGQTCLDWLNAHPDVLSTAFAEQFRHHLARPETFTRRHDSRPAELQLLDDDMLKRQLAEAKTAALLTDPLRAEMLLLFGRIQALQRAASEDPGHADGYGPLQVMRALSRALDAQGIDSPCGTFLLQCVTAPLLDTLKHTYAALNQFLETQGIQGLFVPSTPPAPFTDPAPASPQRTTTDAGEKVLTHIRSIAARASETASSGAPSSAGAPPFPDMPHRLVDRLADWPAALSPLPGAPQTGEAAAPLLRQLQQKVRHSGTGAFDLAVLDALAGLFEYILDDPGISPRYKAEIAHLQIPALRVALVSPDFFSDDGHPARQLIDLLGLFSRRFPEHDPSHLLALEQIQAACAAIHSDPDHATETFAHAHGRLATWLADADTHLKSGLVPDVMHLEQIERQELGTLLALENLHDLTERHPAPESVLRRLENAWVPHMASLYVAEAGEGPDWRAACATLLQLFLSLQAPDDDAARELRLQSIPRINAELRRGLLAQGAAPAQLKDFFSAITMTQESWIRPAGGQQNAVASPFVPAHVSRAGIESLTRQLPATPPNDPILKQAQQLLEGDWVDFDPPFEGLAIARVAWVGVHGYLLFCDREGEQRFSLDCARLAAEIRAGHAQIPEQSLTRKAMLRLKMQLSDDSG
ncbi:DUF1631 family protein [Thiobacillus denitrificans]|uniref:DUF1631 family protein n=1 Tax=Thiobacillus denitrificans TaxID=36861 RepID=UPI00036C5CB8|nr:DUF1631 family protein [Thiobacillus denitrificans]